MADKECIENVSEVLHNLINAVQTLLKHQIPHILGFQNTMLGYSLKFSSISNVSNVLALQILHTPGILYASSMCI